MKLSGQVDAALTAVAGDWDGRTVWTGDGAASGASWIAARTELGRQQAGDLVKLARSLSDCPHVAEAFADGVLGKAKVAMLLRARSGVEAVFAEHEHEVIAEVRHLTVDHARIAIARWKRLAPATAEAERDQQARAAAADATGGAHGRGPPKATTRRAPMVRARRTRSAALARRKLRVRSGAAGFVVPGGRDVDSVQK